MDLDSYNKALKTIRAYILKNSGTYYDVNEILHNAIEVYLTKKLKGKIIPGAKPFIRVPWCPMPPQICMQPWVQRTSAFI